MTTASTLQPIDIDQRPSVTLRTVTRIWQEVLQLPQVAGPDNFFSLGGDSLTMMIILYRVTEELGVELAQAVLLDAPTLEQFCEAIDRAKAGVASDSVGSAEDQHMPTDVGVI